MSAAAQATCSVEFPTPRAYVPLLRPSRYKGVWGGRGSAKSHFFAESILERTLLRRTRIVCIREFQRTLQQSAKLLIEDKIDYYGLGSRFHVTNSYIEGPNDSIITFEGMQSHNAESIKSLEGYDVAWVEEAQNLSRRSLDLLRPTIRTAGSELWFSWNPRHPTDPVDELLRGKGGPPPDSIVVGTTYRDNPFFPEVLRLEMEWDRSRDVDKYTHVWLGGYEQHSESRVFKNWNVLDFETPANVTFYFGADWGYSKDPSTLVRFFIIGRDLFIDHEAYRIGVELDELGKLFDSVPEARFWPIRADSARPETIGFLKRPHYRRDGTIDPGFPKMVSATKGPNSVKEGVIFLQGYNVHIHPRCKHAIDEFTHYSFVVDKLSGIVTNELADEKNHIIDPIRYGLEQVRAPQLGAVQQVKLQGFN